MKQRTNIHNILFLAFIFRLVLLIINTYILVLPQGGGDALSFENGAYHLSISNYDIDFFYYLSSGARLFELLLSYIYYIIGRYPFILGLIITLLGVYTVQLVYKATLLLWKSHVIAKKAALFTALFPVLMLHSAIILREVPVNVFLLLSIIAFIKYWKSKNSLQVFWFIFYTIIATLLHAGSIFILVGFVFFNLFFSKGKSFVSKVIITTVIVFSFLILSSSGFLNKIGGGSIDESIDLLETREGYTLKGDSAYPAWIMLTGSANDIWKIPIRFIAFLFSPLIPFWAKSVWHSIGLIDGFLYLYMFYVIYKKRVLLKYNNTAKGILIMTLFLIFVFSLGVANVGTSIRHRAKMAPLIIVVFTGMHLIKKDKKSILILKTQMK